MAWHEKTSILLKHWFLLLSAACNKQTYFLCPAPHLFASLCKTTITGQCSIDESWMTLINQPDNAACGLSADERGHGGLGPSWMGEQISEIDQQQQCYFISSYMVSLEVLIWCAQDFRTWDSTNPGSLPFLVVRTLHKDINSITCDIFPGDIKAYGLICLA